MPGVLTRPRAIVGLINAVFLDETWCNTALHRAYGWAPIGEQPLLEAPRRGKGLTLIGAMMLASRIRQVHRGDKALSFEAKHWACPGDCRDEDGDPVRFTDTELGCENTERARAAWRETFGEDLPDPVRPGKPVEEPREIRVPLQLTRAEAEALDAARGEQSRSEFLRAAMRRALQERKAS